MVYTTLYTCLTIAGFCLADIDIKLNSNALVLLSRILYFKMTRGGEAEYWKLKYRMLVIFLRYCAYTRDSNLTILGGILKNGKN